MATHQLLNAREMYNFSNFVDLPMKIDKEWVVSNTLPLTESLWDIFKQEFNILADLAAIVEVEDKQVSSNGKFTSVLCLRTGNMYNFCYEIQEDDGENYMIPKEMYFSHALVFTWENVREIDNVQYIF